MTSPANAQEKARESVAQELFMIRTSRAAGRLIEADEYERNLADKFAAAEARIAELEREVEKERYDAEWALRYAEVGTTADEEAFARGGAARFYRDAMGPTAAPPGSVVLSREDAETIRQVLEWWPQYTGLPSRVHPSEDPAEFSDGHRLLDQNDQALALLPRTQEPTSEEGASE